MTEKLNQVTIFDGYKPIILPETIRPELFQQVVATAMRTTYMIEQADLNSVFNAFEQCAKDGLLPDGKEAAIVVYSGKHGKKAQYLPMVDGVIKRARMSGEVLSIGAKCVYQADGFSSYTDETGDHFKHEPNFRGDRGALDFVYAFAVLKNGQTIFEAMTLAEVERVKAASKAAQYGNSPWQSWYDRMALKSVLHRIARRLPNASEMMALLESEDMDFSDTMRRTEKAEKANANAKADTRKIYNETEFAEILPKWRALIEQGKDPEQLIAMLETKAVFTEDQKAQILACGAVEIVEVESHPKSETEIYNG